MTTPNPNRWSVTDPSGQEVVLRTERWAHIVGGHPELVGLEDVLRRAVANPTRRLSGRSPGEVWLYWELSPPTPTRWLKVVVRYGQQENRIVTAFPAEVTPLSITIGNTSFDHVDYDAEADVLYLHVGDPSTAVDFDESPEGHALRFDASGALVGVTIIGARDFIDRGETLSVTVPSHLTVDSDDLKALLANS